MEIKKMNTKCDVCGNDVLVDKYGNGECDVCGWRQSHESFNHPNVAGIRNIPSLNNAKRQFVEGKSAILANFNDFVETFENYGEMQFTYYDITYGIMGAENIGVEFWGMNTDKYETFKDIEEFKLKARIDGKLLKDIWHEVKNANWLQ